MGLVLGLICIVILIHLVVEYFIRKIKESTGETQSTGRDGETNNFEANASNHSATSTTSSIIDLEDIIEKSSICLFIFLILTHFNFFSLFASARIISFLQDFLTLLRGSFMIHTSLYLCSKSPFKTFCLGYNDGKEKISKFSKTKRNATTSYSLNLKFFDVGKSYVSCCAY